MNKFQGILLASDFDNTLLYTEEALRAGVPTPPLPERNRQALEYFMAEGGRFAIATGRALAAFIQFAEQVPMNAPGVVCNGAALYDFAENRYLETAMLDEQARERGQVLLDRFPEMAAEAYHIDNVIHAVQPNAITYLHEHITKAETTKADSLLEVPLPLGKLLFEADRTILNQALVIAEEQGWAGEYELIFSAVNLLEMTVKGANKGGMVRRLAARLGISMENVYCVGDETNDISMLTAAAQGFAPENCSEAVRACGVRIVSHAKDGAIADVIGFLDQQISRA